MCEIQVLPVLCVWIGQADSAEKKVKRSSREIALAAHRPQCKGVQKLE